jgi:hypothetical protein
MIRSLIYIIILIYLDITFVLRCLARYISNLAVYYSYIIKELIQYLRLTIKQKLYFGPRGVDYYNYFIVYIDTN